MAVGMILPHQQGQLLAIPRHLETLVHRFDQLQAAMFVGNVLRQLIHRCQALAQVVQQAGPAHAQRLLVQGSLFQHAQGVHAGVNFRVVSCGLRHAEQRIHLRHQGFQRVAVTQYLDKYLGLIFHQRP